MANETRPVRPVRRWRLSGSVSLSPLTIALAYGLLSIGWISFSDRLVGLIPERELADYLQSVKGMLFVAVTTPLIFHLVARYRRVLTAAAEARATERQRRERLDRLLEAVRPADSPGATAQRICTAIGGLPGIELVAYLSVDRGGLVPFSVHPRLPESWRLGRALPPVLGAELGHHADRGAWLVDATGTSAPGSLAAMLERAGLRDAVIAPLRHDRSLVGVVLAAAAPPASAAAHLEAVVEVARMASGWMGPVAVATRDRERRRDELLTEAGLLEVAFQPIVDLARGRTVGYEALARFPKGAAPAGRFAEAAELGIGLALEEAAISRALQEAPNLPPGGWLALNVSGSMLRDRPRLKACLADADRRIVLELTEQETITDYACIRAALIDLGPDVRLAIDDIGEAFSGLRHLVELGPAFVKLDLALVRDIDADPARQALVAGLHHYARQTGAELIAEGIETAAERRALRALGVRLGQGFLLGRPARADRLGSPRLAAGTRHIGPSPSLLGRQRVRAPHSTRTAPGVQLRLHPGTRSER